MAARDELRYSVEIPLIEEQLAQTEQQYLSLGTIGEFKQRLNTLLEASLDRGDATRVDHILECLGQVEALELQLMQDAQSGLLSLETATAGAAASSSSGAARAAAMAAGAEGSEEESLDDSGDEGISRRGGPAARRGAGLIRGITIDPESIQDLPFLVPTPGRLSPGLPEEPEAPPVVLETGPLTCPICFDDWEESDARAYRRCGHRYCRECLDGHLRTLINEGKVSNEDLQCPNPACQVFPSSDEIKTLVAEETYEKYLQFLVLNELKRDDTVRWCINKACAQPIMWDPSVPKIECPACHTLFCYNCKAAWHEGKACEFVQTKEDEQFIRYIKAQGSATKPCPRCHTAISKNSGCNHMTCANCRHQWCWLCLEDYGSGHYSEGPCAGMQFTQADSLWGARAKDIGKKAAIGAGCVVAAPLVIAGGAVVLVGGLVALPFYAASKLFRR